MSKPRERRVRSIHRIFARPARQSWGAFSTSVFGGNIHVLVSQSPEAPEDGAYAVAIPARWLNDVDDLDTATVSNYDCKYGITDIIIDTYNAQATNPRKATIAADRGEPSIAIISVALMKTLDTDLGHLTNSDLLEAPRTDGFDPADLY